MSAHTQQKYLQTIYEDTLRAIEALERAKPLKQGQILVVGASTSEVAGERIGTQGNLQIGEAIYTALSVYVKDRGIYLAFQCCEHLNRALVIERQLQISCGLDQVSAIPVVSAGGSMATYAYQSMNDPVLAEAIRADAGIDIGETMIGMHLRPVAVPVRYSHPYIGQARVVLATTRPKLIGGARAVYIANS